MRKLTDSVRTVEKLKQALFSCLNEKSYADITITEIAKRAGINRTTFYLFFESKDELCMQLCGALVDRWFQLFFDLNINKSHVAGNADMEKALFGELLSWIRQWRPALKRISNVRTASFDGFTQFTEEFEKRMAAQSIFQTEDEMKRKKYSLFIKMYALGLAATMKWWFDEGEGFEAKEFHEMIERLRYKGYYSILND